jgi:hypothetical protein
MTPAQIRRRKQTIEKHQWKWDTAENELQQICQHPNVEKKYRGDTGNYDRTADSYWIDFKCPDCGKKWWESQ